MNELSKRVVRLLAGGAVVLLLAACSEDFGVDQHGQAVKTEALSGKWLVINYWAQWCAPCRTEIPELNALDHEVRGRNIAILGVNFDALQGDKLAKAAEDMGITFRVLATDPTERFRLPRAEALPVTYIVDTAGHVRERLLGEQTAAGLTARLTELMAEE